jgi:hypothetical protein
MVGTCEPPYHLTDLADDTAANARGEQPRQANARQRSVSPRSETFLNSGIAARLDPVVGHHAIAIIRDEW